MLQIIGHFLLLEIANYGTSLHNTWYFENGDKATMNVSLPLSKQHTKVEINLFCLEYGIDDAVECDGLLHVV